jgi:hypothetical protein
VIKGILRKLATIVAVSSLMASFGMVCYANNHSDSDFNFSLDYSTGNPYAYTDLRVKEDDSYSYINYTSGNYSFTACVVAGDDGVRVDDDAIRLVSRNIIPGNSYFLTNYVKEDGNHNMASIRGESNYDWYYNASGLWSPDSIGW